jgi:chitin synthase
MTASEIPERDLEAAIRRICATADLDDLTKKKVRKQLEQQFGVDLAVRKDTINSLIEKVLTASDDRQ